MKKLNNRFKSTMLYIPTRASGEHTEFLKDINPDNEIKNLVMDNSVEHLYEHRKFVRWV